MSDVIINTSALNRLLHSSTGPVGQFVEKKARNVLARSRVLANEGGPGGRPRVRTGDLLLGLDAYGPFFSPRGAFWHVGSNAIHHGVRYPALIEKGGVSRSGVPYRYPYLEPALPPDFRKI